MFTEVIFKNLPAVPPGRAVWFNTLYSNETLLAHERPPNSVIMSNFQLYNYFSCYVVWGTQVL